MAERKQQARLIQRFQSGGKQGISQFLGAIEAGRTFARQRTFSNVVRRAHSGINLVFD